MPDRGPQAATPRPSPSNGPVDRGRLSRRAVLTVAGFAAGAALGRWLRPAKGTQPEHLRPPGARDEPEFLSACIRCGQCVEVCPFDTLKLLGPQAGLAIGTPTFDPEQTPCYLCKGYDSLRCIDVCPTQALEPVECVEDVAIGIAVIDRERCWAYNGVVCRACWHACPFPNEAIRFDAKLRPVVCPERCVGCGRCTHACPTEPTSIPVEPIDANDARRRHRHTRRRGRPG